MARWVRGGPLFVDRRYRFTREFILLSTYAPRVERFYPALVGPLETTTGRRFESMISSGFHPC